MEANGPQRDRSRPPSQHPRAPSRSSTNTSLNRMTPKSSNNSATNLVSPSLPANGAYPPPHRFHQSRSSLSGRVPPLSLSREPTDDLRPQNPPVLSSFLQEKLSRERKLESNRSSRRLSADLSASADLTMRATQSSPVRTNTGDGRRPRSSGGDAPAPKKKGGMGLKEMEQTVSTLHKLNFDLKLELFHRREKQTALEARIEKLESEQRQMEEMNDRLIEELEKRDKAVEEAVAMIVRLEARIDQSAREKEMVRQVESNYYNRSRSNTNDTLQEVDTPRMTSFELARLDDEAKAIQRMPSFLSEFSETTENLRNVYLGVRGSLLSLRRPGDIPDRDGMASPSLSVLSESSFLSIYGERSHDRSRSTSQAKGNGLEEVPPFDLQDPKRNDAEPGRFSKERGSTSSRVTRTHGRRRSSSRSSEQGPANIGDILKSSNQAYKASPLQRLEKKHTELSKSMFGNMEGQAVPVQEPVKQARPLQPKTKQEKRAALERVMTEAAAKDLPHSHALPPTPDTISTSTLRHYKNSNDNMSQPQGVKKETSYPALTETTASLTLGGDMPMDGRSDRNPPSTSAFDGRKDLVGSGYFDTRPPLMQRPRSAGDTTVSGRRDNWDFDSDESDLNSVSSYDPWMRESFKPNRATGRTSPDLFSFPLTTSGWATDALFGSLHGSAFMGAPASGLRRDPLDELIPTPQTALFSSGLSTPGAAPPPPPNRRSSLHAQTGSTSASANRQSMTSTTPNKARRSPVRGGSISRSGSSDGRPLSQAQPAPLQPAFQLQQQQQPPPQQQQPVAPAPAPMPPQPAQAQDGKPKNHYPPISGQVPRSRGLNSLFRRSGSESAPSSAGPTETTFAAASARSGGSGLGAGPMVGMPSWGHRATQQLAAAADDDRASATPPPILRNRVPGRNSLDGLETSPPLHPDQDSVGGARPPKTSAGPPPGPNGAALPPPHLLRGAPASAVGANGHPMTPSEAVGVVPGSPGGVGGSGGGGAGGTLRRKWLGLGRVGSLRNRAG